MIRILMVTRRTGLPTPLYCCSCHVATLFEKQFVLYSFQINITPRLDCQARVKVKGNNFGCDVKLLVPKLQRRDKKWNPSKHHSSSKFAYRNQQLSSQEIYFYVGRGDLLRSDDITKESVSTKVQDSGNKELVEALTTGDGLLAGGMQPGVRTASDDGTKQLLESVMVDSAKVEKVKAKKEKKEKTEKVEPKTLEEPPGLLNLDRSSHQNILQYLQGLHEETINVIRFKFVSNLEVHFVPPSPLQ